MLVIIFRDFGPLYVFIRFRDIKKKIRLKKTSCKDHLFRTPQYVIHLVQNTYKPDVYVWSEPVFLDCQIGKDRDSLFTLPI